MMKQVLFFLIVVSYFSCSRDVVAEPDCTIIDAQTYREVKLILNESCAYTNCHLNNVAPGNFDTYAGISSFLQGSEGSFRAEINSGDMPPEYADEGKTTITPLEKLQLTCWLDNGFPEE